GSGRSDRPGVSLLLQRVKSRVGERCRLVKFQPTRGQASGQEFLKGLANGSEVAGLGRAYGSGDVAVRGEIEADGPAFFPVGRNLENRWTAESTMGEEHLLAKGMMMG